MRVGLAIHGYGVCGLIPLNPGWRERSKEWELYANVKSFVNCNELAVFVSFGRAAMIYSIILLVALGASAVDGMKPSLGG